MQKLEQLYRKIAQVTVDQCGQTHECKLVYGSRRCCSADYCQLAKDYTQKHYDVELVGANHPIPFLARHGCTIDPEYRPICSLHTCLPFPEYLRLRSEIALEASRRNMIPLMLDGREAL